MDLFDTNTLVAHHTLQNPDWLTVVIFRAWIFH